MKKRILSMLLAIIMVVPMLVSCSQSETKEDASAKLEGSRSTIWLTLYAITDEKTTDAAIEEVQEAVNNLTYLRYKTFLKLKYYTKSEYQAALDEAQEKFEKLAEEAALISESIKASQKEEKAAEKTMSAEALRKKKQQERLAAKESIRASKQAEQERLDRIEQGLEEPPAPVTDPQMDIVFIESFDKLVDMIDAELLVKLDDYLAEGYTILTDYIQSSVMNGVRNAGNGTTYAIPTNSLLTPEGSFLLVNKALADKYNIDMSTIKSIKDLTPHLATIKANEPTILPVEKPVTTLADIDFYGGVGMGYGVVNSEEQWLGTSGEAVNPFASSNAKDHFKLMYEWRLAGYFTTATTAFTEDSTYEEITVRAPADKNADWFATVRDGSYYDIEKWENDGYYVITHKSPEYTTENSLKTFYGISVNTKHKDRCMEILKMMTTDSQLKNLLQYGKEGVHYTVNEDKTTITKTSDDYTMDFYGTGNTFIGYVPEEYGADYISQALELSKVAKINGFIGFDPRFDEETQAVYDSLPELTKPFYEKLLNGTPSHNSVIRELNTAMNNAFKEHELSYSDTLVAFNDTYQNCLRELNETSMQIRPIEGKEDFDFISDKEAYEESMKPSSTVDASAPASTVPSSSVATSSVAASSSKK